MIMNGEVEFCVSNKIYKIPTNITIGKLKNGEQFSFTIPNGVIIERGILSYFKVWYEGELIYLRKMMFPENFVTTSAVYTFTCIITML